VVPTSGHGEIKSPSGRFQVERNLLSLPALLQTVALSLYQLAIIVHLGSKPINVVSI